MSNSSEQVQGAWLIYGAYGFTGRIIAEEAARRGLTPVLAGRNAEKIRQLADSLKLESRVFDVETVRQFADALEGITLVLNCAGPFKESADTIVQACISRGVHYLDISGEPDMFEKHLARNEEAASSGSVVIPGVGFDVVASDTLAKNLADKLPGAEHLQMAFCGDGKGSAGSAKTVLQMMSDKCKVRRNGKIVRRPLAFSQLPVPFSDREEWCMSIPWGDISTAYHSTGIPNVTMYMAAPRKAAIMLRLLSPFFSLFALPALQKKLFSRIENSVEGPDDDTRKQSCMRLWGRVSDSSGNSIEATLDTLEGFTFTTNASLLCVERVLSGGVPGGCYTPTQAFGANIALELPGSVLQWRE